MKEGGRDVGQELSFRKFRSQAGPQHWCGGKRTELSDGFISLKRKQQQKCLKGNAIKIFESDFDSD